MLRGFEELADLRCVVSGGQGTDRADMLAVGSAQGAGEPGGCAKWEPSRSGVAVPGRRGVACGARDAATYSPMHSWIA